MGHPEGIKEWNMLKYRWHLHNHLHRQHPNQYFNLLMCNWTDFKHSSRRLRLSGLPSALVSPLCLTYVAIDQAPVSACHICPQTSVVPIRRTVTDDHACASWCRWLMEETPLHVTFSLLPSSDEQCRELLLLVVENTLLRLNKLRSSYLIGHTHIFYSSLTSSSFSCTCFCHSCHALFSLARTFIKWKQSLRSSELAQHHFAVLTRTRSTGRTIYSFCLQQRGWAPCFCSLWLYSYLGQHKTQETSFPESWFAWINRRKGPTLLDVFASQ